MLSNCTLYESVDQVSLHMGLVHTLQMYEFKVVHSTLSLSFLLCKNRGWAKSS